MRASIVRTIVLVLVALAAETPIQAGQLSPDEAKIVAEMRSNSESAERLLQEVVDINSGTMNFEGVRKVGGRFAKEFRDIGFATRWVDLPPEVSRAGHLFAETRGTLGKRILLIGHLDTVFEKESPFQKYEKIGDRAKGPGVSDMKGGLVAILFALKSLYRAGALTERFITVALLGDEENIGYPSKISRHELVEAAKRSDLALAFEGAGAEMKEAAVSRRGATLWTLEVIARGGHSSIIFGEEMGMGAVLEASRVLHEFFSNLRDEVHLTFNPGLFLGGSSIDYNPAKAQGFVTGKSNIVASQVRVIGDLRFLSRKQELRVQERMKSIAARSYPHTTSTLQFEEKIPSMPATPGNRRLLSLFSRVSEDLGYGKVAEEHPLKRGAGDVSFVADQVDSLDGLGVLGAGEHSPEETIDLPSLTATAQKTALMVYRLTR